MNKKFKLIENDSIEINDHKLYRLQALIDFNDVKAGDLGGYVENENNLSQMGNCWIYDNAKVYGNARVYDNAYVFDNASVYVDACVYGNAQVSGRAHVYDNAKIYDNAQVFNNAHIYGNAYVYDSAWIFDNARVFDRAQVSSNAQVSGNTHIFGNAHISGDAIIKKDSDYIVFKNSWSSGRYFTYTKSNKMWRVGCFYGSGDELIKKAYADSENSGKHYEVYVNLVQEIEKLDNETD